MLTHYLVGIWVGQGRLDADEVRKGDQSTRREAQEMARGYTEWMLLKYPFIENRIRRTKERAQNQKGETDEKKTPDLLR